LWLQNTLALGHRKLISKHHKNIYLNLIFSLDTQSGCHAKFIIAKTILGVRGYFIKTKDFSPRTHNLI
jgi:hypothetical protein